MFRPLLTKILPHWQLSLLFILFLPLLLRLGFWQLERAEEKQQLLLVYQEQKKLPAKHFNFNEPTKGPDFQTVMVRGIYDKKRYWLLDNQSRAGQAGYEVVMPLKVYSEKLLPEKVLLESDNTQFKEQWLLVNRGWVAALPRREQLPNIETPDGIVSLRGNLYQSSKNAVFGQAQSDLSIAWPKRVLQLDHQSISTQLNGVVYSKQLRIDTEAPGALVTQWQIINTRPEKHQAYAVQWFAMAFALCILYGLMLRQSFKE